MRTETQEAKDYLIRSLDQAIHTKDVELIKEFNLVPLYPKDGKELKEFVAKGYVKVSEKLADDRDFEWENPFMFISFEDPERKADKDGYDKAQKEMRKEASKVKDAIIVKGAEAG